MCNTWQHPSDPKDEIPPEIIEKLPARLGRVNVTGGEPMLRKDIDDVIAVISKKTRRCEISTNGYFTDRIIDIAGKFPEVVIRVSLEGLASANDDLRGIKDGFDHGLRTLLKLKEMGVKDIGFAITVSDRNAGDIMELFALASGLDMEFATAATHNSFYFHKMSNAFENPDMIVREFEKLITRFLKSWKPKQWYRGYFNYGLTRFVRGKDRLLPCTAGTDMFFLDPYGEVFPCNMMEESMGNLREQTFEEIWSGDRAREIREKVKNCPMNCWMVGTAGPAMRRHIWTPTKWIIENKLRLMMGKEIRCNENS
ncbi:MAG: SPASM domain-containing protein [Candidatus Eisenbacteria sp.]|nr:SPASM domain-containing protein [Candidatus Eisenbacteria bacterium]